MLLFAFPYAAHLWKLSLFLRIIKMNHSSFCTDLAITTLIWLSISSSLSTSFISCISPTLRLHPIAGIAGQEKNTSIHAPVNELSLVVWIILQ